MYILEVGSHPVWQRLTATDKNNINIYDIVLSLVVESWWCNKIPVVWNVVPSSAIANHYAPSILKLRMRVCLLQIVQYSWKNTFVIRSCAASVGKAFILKISCRISLVMKVLIHFPTCIKFCNNRQLCGFNKGAPRHSPIVLYISAAILHMWSY